MSDFFMTLSQNPQMRRVISGLGLPLPMPEPLNRAEGPWAARPLEGRRLLVGAAPEPLLLGAVARVLAPAGATALVAGDDAIAAPFADPGEAYGHRIERVGEPAEGERPERLDGIVFDASGVADPAGLGAVYELFHPWIGALGKSGRIVVLARTPDSALTAQGAAAQAALEGFVRSLAKEVGKRGATAQLLYVGAKAEDRVPPVLRWLLSKRPAYVSGQPLTLSSLARAPEELPATRPLEHKLALVTGAARGIGNATARRLAEEGAHVLCLDRPNDEQLTAELAQAIGGSPVLVDITSDDAPERIAEAIRSRGGSLDVLIHNAGITRDKTLKRMTRQWWDQAIDVNLGAVVRIDAHLQAEKLLADHARLVYLSSVAGIAGNFGQTNYAASKSGLVGYVRHLSGALAKQGITANAVAPGFIETRLTDAIPLVIREFGRRMNNLSQGGQPVDVAEALTFLASPGSVGLSGQVLRVCGGALIGA